MVLIGKEEWFEVDVWMGDHIHSKLFKYSSKSQFNHCLTIVEVKIRISE